MTPVKAIRAKCLDCCYDQVQEVRLCPAQNCPLWPYRMGKRPNAEKREMTEAQRATLEKARLARKSLKNYNVSEHEGAAKGRDTTLDGGA